jgi:glycosyltransferase involved in cell wall biosynthesis
MFNLYSLMESKLRIAIVANANSIHTVRWVNWLEKKGHEVSVFSLKEGEKCTYFGPEPRLDRSLIIDLGNDVRKATKKLQLLIDEFKPDLIHGFFLTNHAFYAGRMGNYPIIVTAMGSDVLVHPKESKLLSWVIRKTGKNSMKVVCPPLLVKDLVKLGIEENKIITNLIGINTEIFKPLKKENQVIFSRGFKDIYNPKVVADAIILVHKREPEIKFYLAGEGPLRQGIEEKLVNHNVDFTGQLTEKELGMIMGKSKVVISSSLSDSIPLTVFEAMACGSILIVSNNYGHRQWDKEKYPILFFGKKDAQKLADLIVKSCYDETLLEEALAQGPELVKLNWSWEKQANLILEEYRNIIK